MRQIVFDLDDLRSFVTGIDLGSFARAADRLGRSTSAVSAHLKKLEEQTGQAILRKAGRNMVPTETGEVLLAYARRLLELNDEAAAALRGTQVKGEVRLGLQEDFGEGFLTQVLGRFARSHPQVRIEVKVARNALLLEQITSGQLDLALAWDAGVATPYSESVGKLPMCWIGPLADRALSWTPAEPLPLVILDAPCLMRTAAINALEQAGIAWRVAFTSPSLSSNWSAVAAGLGVTVRTPKGIPAGLCVLDAAAEGLPVLPKVGLRVHRADAELNEPAQMLRDILLQILDV